MEKNCNSHKTSPKDLIEVGKISKPFGVKGEVIAIDYSDDYDAFINRKRFFAYVEENGTSVLKSLNVKGFRGHRSKIIMGLEDVDSINESEKLKNRSLYIYREDILLKKGEYLFADLIGCQCYSEGMNIGKVMAMPNYGTCDIFEIKCNKDSVFGEEPQQQTNESNKKKKKPDRRDILNIPYFKDIIEKIDIENKSIYFKESYKDYI